MFVNSADRVTFEAVATSGDDVEAFTAALGRARAGKWLEPLVEQLVAENLEDGTLAQALASKHLAPGALQAMSRDASGLSQPHLTIRTLNAGMQWTAKILIDGEPVGTGVLIGPHLVLTAWHVVCDLFTPDTNDTWRQTPNGHERLRVELGDFLTFIGARRVPVPAATLIVPAHAEWCTAFSTCHDDELESKVPDDPKTLEGFWDYAVIRLARAPGLERAWARLDERSVVPKTHAEVMVFQHPAGHPLRVGRGKILAQEKDAPLLAPRLRFLHGVDTRDGTSGGPCFDQSFALFGLHQGEWTREQSNGGPINRGVPIARVVEHLENQPDALPAPDGQDVFLWKIEEDGYASPVIGADKFQSLVWRSALSGQPRLIEIVGDKKSGKSYLLSVLAAMLPAAGHLTIRLYGAAVSKLHAARLAGHIVQLAGAPAIDSSATEPLDTTVSGWIRDVLVRRTVAALDQVRGNRSVWIAIGDLSDTDIQGEHASDFLHALYEQTRTVPWLRVVLDGMRSDLAASVKGVTERYKTNEISLADVEAFLRRGIVATDAPVAPDAIALAAAVAYDDYEDALKRSPATALEHLASGMRRCLTHYLRIFAGIV